jgi:hypothetical protein
MAWGVSIKRSARPVAEIKAASPGANAQNPLSSLSIDEIKTTHLSKRGLRERGVQERMLATKC